jgi:large subunit ribosomal protein L17
MRHNKKFNHLGRKSAHRKAMLSNMATSLILHKRIKTTEAKAKALRMYVEPLITKSKQDSTHNRRNVFAMLRSKEAVTELFREVSMKVADRPGGYTRIIKLGKRLGDNAEMCMIELVDFNEHMLSTKETKKKSRRSRRGGGTKTTETVAAETKVEEKTEAATEVKEEAPKTEEPKAEDSTEEKKAE